MTTCDKCGGQIEFITNYNGRRVPIHLSGSCTATEGSFNFSIETYSNYYSNFSSYTNPNAKCPVCGEPVYFYQSENGGRVFFDELGPPWPKHYCTDSSIYKPKKNLWIKNGWHPFWLENYYEDYGRIIITGQILDKKKNPTLCFEVHHESNKKWMEFWNGSPSFLKKIPGKKKRRRYNFNTQKFPTHEISTIVMKKNSTIEEITISVILESDYEFNLS